MLAFLYGLSLLASSGAIEIFGSWHCSDDACIWGKVRDMTEFDSKNHWLIDRGDGKPSVNLVILSFLHPLKLVNQVTDTETLNGVPRGFTREVVQYFKSRGIRVMASIGGITYVKPWDDALTLNATRLGLNAAQLAKDLGIGIEIDWENDKPSAALMQGLQNFINAYRSVHPYDASGNNHAARLTIDLAAGDRWLIDICQKATAEWLLPRSVGNPVLDYGNAMVGSGDGTPSTWQEHIDGKPTFVPPIPPLAAAKFTGSLFLHGNSASCNNFDRSPQKTDFSFVSTVATKRGSTNGMLGFMFWASECEGTHTTCTTPPNSCEKGMGAAAAAFNISFPMPPLRQD